MGMRKVQPGSVSTGTLKTEDLLSAFVAELQEFDAFDQLTKEMAQCCETADALALGINNNWLNDDGLEAASDVVGELIDHLNSLAPDYMSFGAHEGDGADYGWWPSIEALEDAVRDGDCLKVDDLGQVPDNYTGLVMQVSDHGNVELYRLTNNGNNQRLCTPLWSCV